MHGVWKIYIPGIISLKQIIQLYFVGTQSSFDYICNPSFFLKTFCDPSFFMTSYLEENDSPFICWCENADLMTPYSYLIKLSKQTIKQTNNQTNKQTNIIWFQHCLFCDMCGTCIYPECVHQLEFSLIWRKLNRKATMLF